MMPGDSEGMSFFGFVIGGIIVALAVLVFVLYGGQGTGPKLVQLEPSTVTAPQ